MSPTVSVIMAAYNGAALIGETIASLQAQSFADWELIAVDDCSKDDTLTVLRGFDDPRIRVIASDVNGGPVVARNRAFAEARGRYIAALDQDDLCLPERFAGQVAFLDAHPEVVLVSTAAKLLEDGKVSAGHWPRPLTPGLIDWLMLVRNPIVWSSVMFRADAARRLDPFERPEMRYVEDFDLYHRLRQFGQLAQIDEELVLYRCHAGGASNMFNMTMRDHAEALLTERHRAWLGDGRRGDAGPPVPRHRGAARGLRRRDGWGDAGARRPRDFAPVVAPMPRWGPLGPDRAASGAGRAA
jgi:glycosyltransferase involved in cell wall biosynthesis